MPKENRGYSHSSNRSKTSPYPCSSSHDVHQLTKKSLSSVDDIKEWEGARCPVCMEHPHNAVLLLCSSNEKGCHPYMCDTSHRHSNCLDQFRKAFSEIPKSSSHDAMSHLSTMTMGETPATVQGSRIAEVHHDHTPPADDKKQSVLVCPLCRGQVNGWVVVEPARRLMNVKTRSCSCETCDFKGTYADLRKHARVEHPMVRPAEANPERQRDWRRMELEGDLRDVLSTIQSAFVRDSGEDSLEGQMLASIYLVLEASRAQMSEAGVRGHIRIRFSTQQRIPESGARSPSRIGAMRRRSSTYLSGEDLDTYPDSSSGGDLNADIEFDASEDDILGDDLISLYGNDVTNFSAGYLTQQYNQRRTD